MISPVKVLLTSLLFATGLQAQSPSSALEPYPNCAKECITSALLAGLCLPTNQTCICTDETFQGNVTGCVMLGCTIPESLITQNATLAACGAPVRDRSGKLVTVSNTLIIISGVSIIIRFTAKFFVTFFELALDDWCILATMISTVPSACITVYGTTPNGLGKDVWTLTADKITKCVYYFYIMAPLYVVQGTLIKLSFICFFLRIFPSENVHRLLWGTFGLTIAWGFCFLFVLVFQCRPVSYFWTSWDGMHEGKCIDGNLVNWIYAGMSIALDLWVLGIPLWQLRKLQLHWKKKISVAIMLCVGTFVTVVTCLRLQSLVNFAKSSNSSWDLFDISLWSTIEICVGIMCANLPAVRMLLVRAFPALSGSSQDSNGSGVGGSHRYGGQTPSRGTANRSNANTISVTRVNSARHEDGNGSPTGIAYQKSYVVQYSDNDESSLVPMHDLDQPKAWQVPTRDN